MTVSAERATLEEDAAHVVAQRLVDIGQHGERGLEEPIGDGAEQAALDALRYPTRGTGRSAARSSRSTGCRPSARRAVCSGDVGAALGRRRRTSRGVSRAGRVRASRAHARWLARSRAAAWIRSMPAGCSTGRVDELSALIRCQGEQLTHTIHQAGRDRGAPTGRGDCPASTRDPVPSVSGSGGVSAYSARTRSSSTAISFGMTARTLFRPTSATSAKTSSSNATARAARDPPSFEAGDEGTTDVREKTAHGRRHDQAPQSPDQVGGERRAPRRRRHT